MPPNDAIPALAAAALTKRFGRRAALTQCDLDIPRGRVVGLVGPNGAGKSTLLQLACGLITPTAGTIRVLGQRPAANAAALARVGFVAQDTPVYTGMTVADHLRLGAHLNPRWDAGLANRRIAEVGLEPNRKAGRLSGGQRAQLSLTIAAAKRPELLILDEPAAALDPLARAAFLASLLTFVAELGAGAVLSSHLLADVAQVCDHLVVLSGSRVQLAGDVAELLVTHHRVVAARGLLDRWRAGIEVVHVEREGAREWAVVRADRMPSDLPGAVETVSLEELVLAYLTRAAGSPSDQVVTIAGERAR